MFSKEFGNHSFGCSYFLIWLFYLQANRTSPRQSQVPPRTVSAGLFYQRPGGQTAQSPALPASVPQEPADLNHLLHLPCSQPCLHSQGVGSVWATVMKHIILCPHKWHAQCLAAKKLRERGKEEILSASCWEEKRMWSQCGETGNVSNWG